MSLRRGHLRRRSEISQHLRTRCIGQSLKQARANFDRLNSLLRFRFSGSHGAAGNVDVVAP
jgi:hypothetical protein